MHIEGDNVFYPSTVFPQISAAVLFKFLCFKVRRSLTRAVLL